MDQQNQQLIQEKTENKPSIKTNWKFLAIVVVVAAVLIGGGFITLVYQQEVRQGEKILPITESWTFEKALQTALAGNNPSICEKINQRHSVQDYGVSPKQAREGCKYTYAIEKNDIDYCLTLSEKFSTGAVSTQDACLRELAKKLKRPELCDLMPSKDYISLCKLNASEKQEDKSDTATWQTYRNSEFGFEVRYPEGWLFNEYDDTIDLYPAKNYSHQELRSNILLKVIKNSDNLTIEDYVKKFYGDIKLTSISVAGLDAKRTSSIPAYAKEENVFIIKDNKIYRLTLVQHGGEEITMSTLDQILSTFRFVE